MDIREAEEALGGTFTATLPSDGKTVVTAVNRGIPFVVSHPDTVVAQNVFGLARTIASGNWQEQGTEKGVVDKIWRLFG